VTFYERFTLEMRQGLSVFIGLVLPHATHLTLAGAPEAINLPGVTGEMEIQGSVRDVQQKL